MKYLINQTVYFNAREGILNLATDEDLSIQLSKPGMRLLNELITHSGITQTREALLQRVWEDHGLVPSNSNLSNHISFLRKVLSQLGLQDNVIVTEPREGFRLQADVEKIIDAEVQEEGLYEDERRQEGNISESELKPDCVVNNRTRFINRFIKKDGFNKLLITLTVLLLVVLIIINQPSPERIFHLDKNTSDSIAFCQIVDLDSNVKEKGDMDFVKKLISDKNINCIKQKSTIYLKRTEFTPGLDHSQQAVFFSQCFSDRNGKESKCENYLTITIRKP